MKDRNITMFSVSEQEVSQVEFSQHRLIFLSSTKKEKEKENRFSSLDFCSFFGLFTLCRIKSLVHNDDCHANL